MKAKGNERKRTFLLITIPILVLFFMFNTLPLIKGVIYRQSVHGGGAEREGDTESETGSRL